MAIIGSSLKHMPGCSGVLLPRTKFVHSWPSRPMPWPVRWGSPHVFAADLDQFSRARLFEAGTDPGRLALRRQDRDERPLAESPADAGEVEEARAALED